MIPVFQQLVTFGLLITSFTVSSPHRFYELNYVSYHLREYKNDRVYMCLSRSPVCGRVCGAWHVRCVRVRGVYLACWRAMLTEGAWWSSPRWVWEPPCPSGRRRPLASVSLAATVWLSLRLSVLWLVWLSRPRFCPLLRGREPLALGSCPVPRLQAQQDFPVFIFAFVVCTWLLPGGGEVLAPFSFPGWRVALVRLAGKPDPCKPSCVGGARVHLSVKSFSPVTV